MAISYIYIFISIYIYLYPLLSYSVIILYAHMSTHIIYVILIYISNLPLGYVCLVSVSPFRSRVSQTLQSSQSLHIITNIPVQSKLPVHASFSSNNAVYGQCSRQRPMKRKLMLSFSQMAPQKRQTVNSLKRGTGGRINRYVQQRYGKQLFLFFFLFTITFTS